MRRRTVLVASTVVWMLAGAVAVGRAATIAVPRGGDLQAALNAAQDGDVITLTPGAVYLGNFVLPAKPGVTHPITVRSATPDAQLPPAGVRLTPAAAPLLAVVKSPNSSAALRTAAGAHHWTLQFLEFQANLNGYGDIIELGAADRTQTTLAQVPYALVLDRLYVHGDPGLGQKRGIALNSRDTTIVNTWVADCKAVGQDAQAIAGWNGPGSYVIANNYLEGAGENLLIGGTDPTIPNLVTTNVTIQGNYLTKPVAWRTAIVATPTGVTATAVPGGGTLPAGAYAYTVVARTPAGQTTKATSAPSAAASVTVSSRSAVTISWSKVPGATDYLVYGRAVGAPAIYWTTSATTFKDSGVAGTSGSPGSASRWTTKNVLELKNAQDVLIDGNVIEHAWVGDQPGYPVVFTPRNQGGTAPWTVVQRVTFTKNLVRHAAGAVNILGTDNVNPSQLTNHIAIANNVFDDLGTAWGAGAKTLLIGAGPTAITIDHNTIVGDTSTIVSVYGGSAAAPMPVAGFSYTNNMSAHDAYGIMGANYSVGLSTIAAYFPASSIARNVLAGGSASKYPAGNFFPSMAQWQGAFVDFANGNYRLAPGSAFANAATDGTDLGADIDAVNAETSGALSGIDATAAAGSRPTVPSAPMHVRVIKSGA